MPVSSPDVIVAGTVALDLVAPTAAAQTASAAAGNSGANIAIRLAQAGLRVAFLCLIGDDAPGRRVVADLTRWNVSVDHVVVRPGYRTPIVYQITSGGGSGAAALSSACPQCARPRGHRLELPAVSELPDATWDAIGQARAVVVDVPGQSGAQILSHAQGLTWYEASLRESTAQEMLEAAQHARYVKVSEEDSDHYRPVLEGFTGRTDFHVLTRGAAGTQWRDRSGEWRHVPAAPIAEVVDTVGAGDALTAGTLAALVAGESSTDDREGEAVALSTALAHGAREAAAAIGVLGARGDMTPPDGGTAWLVDDAPFHCTACIPWE